MELEDFVAETLRSIVLGTSRARIELANFVSIAPAKLNGVEQHTVTEVTFDVAVTVSNTTSKQLAGDVSTGAKLKVLAVDLSLGASGAGERIKTEEDNRVSRVSFSIPITLTAHHRNDPNMEHERANLAAYDSQE